MGKCMHCNSELNLEDVVVSSNGWVYCKKCKSPYCDLLIQDKDHWIKSNLDKVEQKGYIDLVMEGYC